MTARTVLQLATLPEPTERSVEHLCDQLVAQIGGKDAVVKRSPPHKFMGTPGIPDRRYILWLTAWDFEVKKPTGELSDEQIVYLRREIACGNLAGAGGVDELKRCIFAIRDAQYGLLTWRELVAAIGATVEEWVQKREAERQAVKDRRAARFLKAEEREREKADRAARRAAKSVAAAGWLDPRANERMVHGGPIR